MYVLYTWIMFYRLVIYVFNYADKWTDVYQVTLYTDMNVVSIVEFLLFYIRVQSVIFLLFYIRVQSVIFLFILLTAGSVNQAT